MAQPTQAVGGSNDTTVVAAEPTLEDRFAATLSDEKRDEEQEPQGDLIDDDVADAIVEDEPQGETDEIEVTDDDLPPIAAPVSWTAEEKEEFSQLPRALQETLSRRESEREKFVQTKAQEAKQTKSAVEREAVEAIGRIENAHVETLKALLPEIPQRPSAHLMAQNPQQYAYQMEAHENALAQHQYVQQVARAVNQRLAGLEQQAHEQQAAEDAEVLREQFPEYLDEGKKPELKREFQSTLRALGYSDDQIDNAGATDILALRQVSQWKAKADKLDTLMKRQMEKVRSGKLPSVSKPGSAQGKGAIQQQRYEADRNAMRNGDKDAANRVFAQFL